MRIYKRAKTWWIDYVNDKGERCRESTKTNNRSLAEQILAKRKTDIAEGKFGIAKAKPLTFKELVEKYFDSAINMKPSTLKRYKVSFRQLLPYFGNKMLKDISAYDIEKYRQERLTGREPGTINRDLAFMRRVYNVAKKWKDVLTNPIDEIDFLKENNIRTWYFEISEILSLLNSCLPLSYLHLAVNIAIHTGMRKGEIMSLVIPENGQDRDKINWIDIDNRCFHLNVTKSSKYRQVPINDVIFKLLQEELKGKESGRLFKHKDIRCCFETAIMKAGIKNGIFHDLRRTFISHAMMAGYSREVIQKVVGQEDPRLFERYAHLAPDMRKQVVQEIGRRFDKPSSEEKIANHASKGMGGEEILGSTLLHPDGSVILSPVAPKA